MVSDGGRLDWSTTSTPSRTSTTTWCPAPSPAEVAWAVGAEGPATVVSTGCTSGLDAVGHAAELIREGIGRRHDRRRHRRADLADHGGLLRRDQGDHRRATTTRSTPPGRSTAPATGSCSARARPCSSWRNWSSARAPRRAHLRRDRRVRHPQQRLPHDRAAARRPGDGRGDPGRAGRGPARPARQSTTSTRTARAPSRTTGTRPPPFKRSLGEHAYRTPVSSIKSMVGHSLGAIGSIEIAASRAGDRARRGAADGQPARRPTRSATWTTCR